MSDAQQNVIVSDISSHLFRRYVYKSRTNAKYQYEIPNPKHLHSRSDGSQMVEDNTGTMHVPIRGWIAVQYRIAGNGTADMGPDNPQFAVPDVIDQGQQNPGGGQQNPGGQQQS